MITSLGNPTVKYIRSLHMKKYRESERRFIVEGLHLLEESIASGWMPVIVAYEPETAERSDRLKRALAAAQETAKLLAVDRKVMKGIAQTATPQGVIAVVPMHKSQALKPGGLVLVLEEIQDPGNLGTIMRAAEAAGTSGVIISESSADPFDGKCLRATAGALFRLPFLADQDWTEIGHLLRGRRIFLAEAHHETAHYRVDWTQPSAVILSNEAHGAGPSARALAQSPVSIPMRGKTESLNVAMAATVIAFEAARQLDMQAETKRVGRPKPSGREGR